jgi:hypothetical protein
MSIVEIERFAADLNSNAALPAEAEKAQAQSSHPTPVEEAVVVAAARGYGFTAGELKVHAKAKAEAAGRKVIDAELDGVAGGGITRNLGFTSIWAPLFGG